MYYFLCIALLFAACNAQADPEVLVEDRICKTRNGFYSIDGSCDIYYECKDFVPTRMICPDGLNYNTSAIWPNFPCGYPADVPCLGRSVSQPRRPTPECPRQHGFFASPLAELNDCSQYRLCADGRAFEMTCPFGLAFNFITSRCDWPERVPGCNTEEFLGFTCPAPEYDTNGNPIVTNYKYEGDCYLFFSCQSGRGRLLSCDPGLAFDPLVGRCINADLVDCDAMYGINARNADP